MDLESTYFVEKRPFRLPPAAGAAGAVAFASALAAAGWLRCRWAARSEAHDWP